MAAANKDGLGQFCWLAKKRCEEPEGHFVCVSIRGHIFQEVASREEKSKRSKVVQLFLKIINALLNEGNGVLCLHATNYDFVGNLTELVDDKVKSMLNDGSLYHEKFSTKQVPYKAVYVTELPRHRYIVKTKERNTQLPFVLTYNTRESLDKGLVDLSHNQFQSLFEKVSQKDTHEEGRSLNRKFRFSENTEVTHLIENTEVTTGCPFKESSNLQAKYVPEDIQSDPDQVIRFIWSKLCPYISAFSKNVVGGSVFFGLKEDRENKTEWISVAEKDSPVTVVGCGWELLKHKSGDEYLLIVPERYRLMKSSLAEYASDQWTKVDKEEEFKKVFVFKEENSGQWNIYKEKTSDTYRFANVEHKTGKFVCKGIAIAGGFEAKLVKEIHKKVDEDTLWVGYAVPNNPIAVKCIPVYDNNDKQTGKMVIEVAIQYYHGIVFTTKKGPDIYKMQNHVPTKLSNIVQPLPWEEWLSAQFNDTTGASKNFTVNRPTFSQDSPIQT